MPLRPAPRWLAFTSLCGLAAILSCVAEDACESDDDCTPVEACMDSRCVRLVETPGEGEGEGDGEGEGEGEGPVALDVLAVLRFGAEWAPTPPAQAIAVRYEGSSTATVASIDVIAQAPDNPCEASALGSPAELRIALHCGASGSASVDRLGDLVFEYAVSFEDGSISTPAELRVRLVPSDWHDVTRAQRASIHLFLDSEFLVGNSLPANETVFIRAESLPPGLVDDDSLSFVTEQGAAVGLSRDPPAGIWVSPLGRLLLFAYWGRAYGYNPSDVRPTFSSDLIWHFGTADEDATANSGHGVGLSYEGAQVADEVAGPRAGRVVRLNAPEIGLNSAQFSTTAGSMSAWVQVASRADTNPPGDNRTPIFASLSGAGGGDGNGGAAAEALLLAQEDGAGCGWLTALGTAVVCPSASVIDPDWHHLALSWTGPTFTVVVDGGDALSADGSAQSISLSGPLVLGGPANVDNNHPERVFYGSLDELRVSSAPRSAESARLEFHSVMGTVGSERRLVEPLWPLFDASFLELGPLGDGTVFSAVLPGADVLDPYRGLPVTVVVITSAAVQADVAVRGLGIADEDWLAPVRLDDVPTPVEDTLVAHFGRGPLDPDVLLNVRAIGGEVEQLLASVFVFSGHANRGLSPGATLGLSSGGALTVLDGAVGSWCIVAARSGAPGPTLALGFEEREVTTGGSTLDTVLSPCESDHEDITIGLDVRRAATVSIGP